MGLFQTPPKTLEEYEQYKPLPIPPDEVLKMDEEEWYAKVYRGADFPQLTVRAVLMGSVLGFFLAFTNLYIGLKTGWALGVAITACIVSYATWNGLLRAGLAKTPMTILETNCMQSTASSAGYSTGGTMVSAISALLMIQGVHLPIDTLVYWTLLLAALGTLMAIPMKRNMINQERLKFPSGTAAAVTLQSLYSEGLEAAKKARALAYSAIPGALTPLLLELKVSVDKYGDPTPLLPSYSKIFDGLISARGTKVVDGQTVKNQPSDWTMVLDHNPVMIAAGALVGLRIAIYMVVGAVVMYYFVGPSGLTDTWVSPNGETITAISTPGNVWKEQGLWLGVSIMVSSGILAFLLQWKTIVRAFTGFIGKSNSSGNQELRTATEPPSSWFLLGTIISGTGVAWLASSAFDVPFLYGLLAVLLTFFLALVACRATGESDITPVGAMGKIMQLTFGTLIPQNASANLMTASITASSAGSSADLLNDLKSGYLLGANPRRQFVAQFHGIFAGTAATVIGFRKLVPTAESIGTTEFPAPAAVAWKAVADVFANGIENMHPTHQGTIYAGLAVGSIMVLLELAAEKLGKKEWKAYLPSATGVGLGLVLPFQYPLSMLIGAIAAHVWMRRSPKSGKLYIVPVAAGLIAGISIMGVIVAVLNPLIFEQ
ncbi:MAG: OPT/YSL family transporter [Planctomycetes bacterium]|nr:OPT/YSL family transporter [Planctomycetota bacterium]